MNAQTKLPAARHGSGSFRLLSLLAAAFLLAVPLTAMAEELVVNGDFEEPDLAAMGILDADGNGWTTFFGQNADPGYCERNGFPECHGGTLVPGWEVYWSDSFDTGLMEPGRVEIQRNLIAGCTPCSQNQKAELDSHHRLAADGTFNPRMADCNVTLLQRVDTCPRTAYTLSYSWRPRTETADDSNMLVVVDDDTLLRTTSTAMFWTDGSYNFIADDDFETTLVFEAFGLGNTYGMLLDDVSLRGQNGSDPFECERIAVCGIKPANLELLYNGPHANGDHYAQDPGEVVIETFASGALPNVVFIEVYDHRHRTGNGGRLFAEEVLVGETFPILNDYSEWNKPFVPPRITIEIRDTAAFELLQRITFHTSCSQPLAVGDQFGGIAVWGFTPRGTEARTTALRQ